MIYLSPTTTTPVLPYWGRLIQPGNSGDVTAWRCWAADNAAFGGRFDPAAFGRMLARYDYARSWCLFAVAPDVVGDAVQTLEMFRPWSVRIRSLGYRVAYVAQDGAELYGLPDADALFIGGSTEWKLSGEAGAMIQRARARGMWVHMGRVNSRKRIAHAQRWGCDSVDGTCPAFGPDVNNRILEPQLRQTTMGALL